MTETANVDELWLLYADETNLDPEQCVFFVYGAVTLPASRLTGFHRAIRDVRVESKVPPDWCVKFNPGPPGLSHQEFVALKQSYLQVAATHGVQMFADVIHHKIIEGRDVNKARRNAINTLLYNFHCLLAANQAHGVVLLDRFTDPEIDNHLREKMSIGLTGMPFSKDNRTPLERVLGIHQSSIGQAHACSLVDVAVGSLRFAVNAHTAQDESKLKTAKTLLGLLSPMFERGGMNKVEKTRFHLSPQTVKVPSYRKQYLDLREFLAGGGIELAQEV